ncbi:hypothetical protein GCM10010413_50210 [Promicromonospora sukumoe]
MKHSGNCRTLDTKQTNVVQRSQNGLVGKLGAILSNFDPIVTDYGGGLREHDREFSDGSDQVARVLARFSR